MPRIAVTSPIYLHLPHLRDELRTLYADVKFKESEGRFTEDQFIEFVRGCDVAVIGLDPINARVLDALPELKTVICSSVGLDHVDAAAVRARGVRIAWKAGANRQSVAELTIALMIDALRKATFYGRGVREGKWPVWREGLHLAGRTVGIHGCGNIGKRVAELLAPFDVTILANDRVDYAAFYAKANVTPVSPEALRARSDIVTIHLPKNESTRGLYDAATLDQLKPGAILVNTARGGIVDEAALKARLADGRIAAAALDVFATEPNTDMELVNMPNVVATPHIGGAAREAWEAVARGGFTGLTDNFLPEPGVYPFD
jgi:phosphoglycerate dehydrogenase-like enzyme